MVFEGLILLHQVIAHQRLPMTITNSNLLVHKDKSFAKIRIQKIQDYAERQSKRTDAEKETDFEDLNEEQKRWIKRRMAGPTLTWEVWNAE